MLQVTPVAAQRVPSNSAHVVVDAELRAGQPLEKNAETSRRHVEATGLEPDSVRVGNPEPLIILVGMGDEVLAASSARIKAVGNAVEGSDRHRTSPVSHPIERRMQALASSSASYVARARPMVLGERARCVRNRSKADLDPFFSSAETQKRIAPARTY